MLDAAELAQVAEVAQIVAAETVRNLSRGTGGAVFPIPMMRAATVQSAADPGHEVTILVDGEDDPSPAVDGTGWTLYPGDRVMVTFVPPHGIYVTQLLSGYGHGDWTPVLSGTSANASGALVTGHYTARQKHVRAWGRYTLGGSPGSWGSGAAIGGLPYPVRQSGSAPVGNVIGTAFLSDPGTPTALPGPALWIVGEGQSGGQLWFTVAASPSTGTFMLPLSSTHPKAQGPGHAVYFEIEYDAD